MFIVYFLIVFFATHLDRLETLTCPFTNIKFPDQTSGKYRIFIPVYTVRSKFLGVGTSSNSAYNRSLLFLEIHKHVHICLLFLFIYQESCLHYTLKEVFQMPQVQGNDGAEFLE